MRVGLRSAGLGYAMANSLIDHASASFFHTWRCSSCACRGCRNPTVLENGDAVELVGG